MSVTAEMYVAWADADLAAIDADMAVLVARRASVEAWCAEQREQLLNQAAAIDADVALIDATGETL